MAQTVQPLQTIEELREMFQRYIDNPGLKRFRNRALPNSGEATDERAVNEFMQKDDEEEFIKKLKVKFAETKIPE